VKNLDRIQELKRNNLSEDVASRLRGYIASGDLQPGTRLVETEVAQKLAVSRGTLREALRILEAE
jgi:DNA-binding GntR family transcriptional regulator